ncbi:hypothetical protein BH24ACT15_BH24ACT15_32930 [soil metagenome]
MLSVATSAKRAAPGACRKRAKLRGLLALPLCGTHTTVDYQPDLVNFTASSFHSTQTEPTSDYQPDLVAPPALISTDTVVSAAYRRGDSFFMGNAFLLGWGLSGCKQRFACVWLENISGGPTGCPRNAFESQSPRTAYLARLSDHTQ